MFKRGQISIFIIVAIVIVGVVIFFFVIRGKTVYDDVPAELQPVFSYYQECIEREAKGAIEIAGLQGGKINVGTYVPGNFFSPYGSHLFFLGLAIPYWYSFSANNLVIENVPTRAEMEREISEFVEEGITNCDFSSFEQQNFFISVEKPIVSTKIDDSFVSVDVQSKLQARKGDLSAIKNKHSFKILSNIGNLHSKAVAIYNKEKSDLFLEKYSLDVLRSYAPVDGVEIQCSPKIWKTREVIDEFKLALEANLEQIKFGNPSQAKNIDQKYFTVDYQPGVQTRIIYSKNWPSKIEVSPADNNFMIAEPIGNQEGLGIIGFCYVPYHFVYDIGFPVMIQMIDGNEIFQFPIVVLIDKNLPRLGNQANVDNILDTDICEFRTRPVRIKTVDDRLNPISADVYYQCFEQKCNVGRSSLIQQGIIEGNLPACVNGKIIAKAENYTTGEILFSSNSESYAEIVLKKNYPLKLRLKVDNYVFNGTALIHFTSEHGTVSAFLPETNNINLPEGLYNVSVYVYGNSSVIIPASTQKHCTRVAKKGLPGLFGSMEDKCFDINVPEMRIEHALFGGGKTQTYILTSELERGEMTVYVSSLPQPNSLEQLQINLEVFNGLNVDFSFP